MRVEARSDSGSTLPIGYLDARSGYTESTYFPLTVGSEYAVYGVTTFLGGAWYYILDDDRHFWPVWKPAPLFEIADPHLPADWTVGYHRWPDMDNLLFSWPEWSSDHYFYERLVDGNSTELELFRGWVRQLEPHKESYIR
jgi:hypothetical protein